MCHRSEREQPKRFTDCFLSFSCTGPGINKAQLLIEQQEDKKALLANGSKQHEANGTNPIYDTGLGSGDEIPPDYAEVVTYEEIGVQVNLKKKKTASEDKSNVSEKEQDTSPEETTHM